MCKSMDPSYEVLSTGGSMISDVLPLCLVSVIHGLPQTIWQSPSKLQNKTFSVTGRTKGVSAM